MTSRSFASLLFAALLALPASAPAQDQVRPPMLFPEFVGTWVLDERASSRTAEPVLVIDITPAGIRAGGNPLSLLKYSFDGKEIDMGGGWTLRFTLVGKALVLTRAHTRGVSTNTITDAISVSGDVLTVDRQQYVVRRPLNTTEPAYIVTPDGGSLDGMRRINVYHRATPARLQ
jgi:hypothetical protein